MYNGQEFVATTKRKCISFFILLACTLRYLTKNADANLMRIQTLKQRSPSITVGLSDHSHPDANMAIPAIDVALAAKVIEKHYTLDRPMR